MNSKNKENLFIVSEPAYLSAGKKLACLFISKQKRAAWKALNDLKVELNRVFNEKLDQEILNKKFVWWHEELERLCKNEARHPLTKAVARDATVYFDSFDAYEQLLLNWQLLISSPPYEWMNQNDLIKFSELSTGGFELLAAEVLLGHKPLHQLREFILHINEANTRINLLRDFGLYIRQGKLPVPLSQLNAIGLVSQEVLSWRQEDQSLGWNKLASDIASLARESAHKAQQWIAPLPPAEKNSQWINQALHRIDMALLNEIEKSDFQVLSQKIELTPSKSVGIVIKSLLLK